MECAGCQSVIRGHGFDPGNGELYCNQACADEQAEAADASRYEDSTGAASRGERDADYRAIFESKEAP